ncbi:MAG: RluA family pseudouridine synthase [bacterium]|nr:RluA family pseudouridine synthase [bacterium]
MNGTLIIIAEHVGKRLDQILPTVLSVSRSSVQKHVKEGQVTVNGKTVAPHYFVKVGDHVAWDITEVTTAVIANANITVPILFEDDDVLVVDKPAGLVVHQGDGHRGSDTLVNWLLHARPIVQGLGDDALRPGIVHRLDRDVSGVMVIAKTKTMYDHLRQLFYRGEMTKEYEAIVYGEMKKSEEVLTFPLARSKTKGWKIAARPSNEEGEEGSREAITHIVRVQALQHYTHILALPKTGRMHQIRVHCAAFGHPIVGDALYAHKGLHPDRAPRLFLHATKLQFTDYNGKKREFVSPAPKIFYEFMREQG